MENLQDAVHKIQCDKVRSLEKAQEIINTNRGPVGMVGMVYVTRTEDGVDVYPTSFGYIAATDGKCIIVQEVMAGWHDFSWKKMYKYLEEAQEGTTLVPFQIIEMG